MKLSDYAKSKGISYRTAYRWFKAGFLDAQQLPTGTILVNEAGSVKGIMSAKKKKALETKGWKIVSVSEFLNLSPEEEEIIEMRINVKTREIEVK